MEVVVVTYTFIGFLFLCVSCLFCQCCMIRRAIDLQNSPPLFYIVPTAPPLDYEPLQEEPTEVAQV